MPSLYSAAVGRDLIEWDGGRLVEIREKRGMTQDQLASASGIAKSRIGECETGKAGEKPNPTVKTLSGLARGLNVPLWVLCQPTGAPIRDRSVAGDDGAESTVRPDPFLAALLARDGVDAGTWQDDMLHAVALLMAALHRARSADAFSGATGTTGRPPAPDR
jgi:transcriptional regulator with XRE-family HTH domain